MRYQSRLLRRVAFCALICVLGLFLGQGWVSSTRAADKAPVVFGTGGAVASADADATRVGVEILRQGGNAVDAAVATAAALGVTEPFSAGIGGGGFMTIYQGATQQVVTLDGRETAPAAVQPDLFQDPRQDEQILPFFPDRISSGLAVGVPGTPLNWETALTRYGTLSLAEALTPAIELAESGFTVDATFRRQVARNQQRFAAFASTAALYLPAGQPPAVGSHISNPDMARAYRLLASQGSNSFYRGPLAEAIVNTVQAPPVVENPGFSVYGGGMELGDLDRYVVRVRPPIVSQYRGYRLYGMGLPSSGGLTVAAVLDLLEDYDLGSMERAQAMHHIIEAERLAFCDRNAFLGDPEYVDVPVAGLRHPDYIDTRRQQLPPQAAAPCTRPGNPLPYQSDPSPSLTAVVPVADLTSGPDGFSTTHLVTADRWGNVVSYTLTLESTGGSGMVVPGYGFILNNELTDFAPIAPHPNAAEPGKRPLSSMAPTIALAPDGRILAWGSPGGSTIITTGIGIATELIDFDQSLADAIAAPRFSQRNGTNTLVEPSLSKSSIAESLKALGHQLREIEELGAATGLERWPNGSVRAVAEPMRRGGGAAAVVRPRH